jgi:hypothetical protein
MDASKKAELGIIGPTLRLQLWKVSRIEKIKTGAKHLILVPPPLTARAGWDKQEGVWAGRGRQRGP